MRTQAHDMHGSRIESDYHVTSMLTLAESKPDCANLWFDCWQWPEQFNTQCCMVAEPLRIDIDLLNSPDRPKFRHVDVAPSDGDEGMLVISRREL